MSASRTMAGPEIERLVQLLGRLPGLGYRSARKATLALLKRRDDLLLPLTAALNDAAAKLVECPICGTICPKPRRARTLDVVLEGTPALWALELAGVGTPARPGVGGHLSPLD